jgi:hypothetical protein
MECRIYCQTEIELRDFLKWKYIPNYEGGGGGEGTPPFVENADGIWHESPLDRFLMELASAWMAGVSELEA